MPYNRNYKKNGKYNGRKRVTYKGVARVAKQIHHKLGPTKEVRYEWSTNLLTNGVVANSFSLKQLDNIAQGDQVNQRDGKKIYMVGAKLNIALQNNGTKSRGIRIIMCKTTNRDGDLLDTSGSWTDLFSNSSFADRTADMNAGDMTSPINTEIVRPILDKQIYLPAETSAKGSYIYSTYVKLGFPAVYADVGATTTLVSGMTRIIIHLCELDSTPSANTVTATAFARVFFKDS